MTAMSTRRSGPADSWSGPGVPIRLQGLTRRYGAVTALDCLVDPAPAPRPGPGQRHRRRSLGDARDGADLRVEEAVDVGSLQPELGERV